MKYLKPNPPRLIGTLKALRPTVPEDISQLGAIVFTTPGLGDESLPFLPKSCKTAELSVGCEQP